ncbi:MAG: KpsF/GutQ family sugar-phosphate isomerase [Planctomycetales bacterium]|nr:KpsF/GutQ family sugar-phosphate isomerase [Planctomycetales bacterium]
MSRSSSAARKAAPSLLADQEILQCGRRVVASEARAVVELLDRLDRRFIDAVKLIHDLPGALIVTGMGKAGLVGQKLAATFASTGTRSHFLHPAEAFHGDLGRVGSGDAVLAFSQSGETAELVQLLAPLESMGVPVIGVTSNECNTLARRSRLVLTIGKLDEACSLGLAPSASTTAMLALGDALALVTSQLRGFRPEDFAKYHPGGALGRKLSRVDDHMRALDQCRLGDAHGLVRDVLVASTRPGRRTGAIMLVDEEGRLAGLFTDSDLARLIERRNEVALDRPIAEVMTSAPTTVQSGEPLGAALELLSERKFSELPVVDAAGRPLGMIDVTDVFDSELQGPVAAHPGGASSEPPVVRLFPGETA